MSLPKEWEALPFVSQQRLPITANIPYFFRWKINQLKLMLNDLLYLAEKHKIKEATELYYIVQKEAEELFKKLGEHIKSKMKWAEELTK